MFGDDTSDDRPLIRICCGPRCGAEIGHRGIYAAVTNFAEESGVSARPTLCQGYCGLGVTVALPDGEIAKVRTANEAPVLLKIKMPNRNSVSCL